jgi:hypothetical protein
MIDKCPECGYAMQNLYINTINKKGKRTWNTINSKYCEKCKIEKPSKEIRIIV